MFYINLVLLSAPMCMYIYNTLLAKKLCDSSFLGKNLDLIHSHFKTDSYIFYILAGYPMVCWPSLLEFW